MISRLTYRFMKSHIFYPRFDLYYKKIVKKRTYFMKRGDIFTFLYYI